MKKFNKPSTLAAIVFFMGIISLILAFGFQNSTQKPTTDWTEYHWFDASGNYIRQNMVDDEIQLTGYDELSYAPYTVRERGYTPAGVTGNPPVPIQPYSPSKRLYSHP
jgi:hypothetical protein